MKTKSFLLLALVLIVSCGKDNKSGKGPSNNPVAEALETDSHTDHNARTYRSRNFTAIVGRNSVKLYNAVNQIIYQNNAHHSSVRVNVRDDFATVIVTGSGSVNYLAFGTNGRPLINIHGDEVSGMVDFDVVAVTYKKGPREFATAVKLSGEVIVPDRAYFNPRFSINHYMLYFTRNGTTESYRL